MLKKTIVLMLSFGVTSAHLNGAWQATPTEVAPNALINLAAAYSDAGDGLAVGNTGDSVVSYTFNGATTSWETPVTLFTGANGADAVAMDPAGDGLAVYVTNASSINASRYSFASDTWFDTEGASIELYPVVVDISVTMSPEGNGLATFIDGITGNLFASQYDGATHTWSDIGGSAVQLSITTGVIQGAASLAMDANSSGVAVWNNLSDVPDNTIQAANYSGSLQAWSNTQGAAINLSLNDAVDNDRNRTVAMSPNGTGLAVWVSNPGSGNVVQSAWYDGGSWQFTGASALNISAVGASGAASSFPLGLTMDADGNGFAIWSQVVGSTSVAQVAYFNVATQAWSTPMTLSSNGADTLSISSLNISFANNGDAIAGWVINNGAEEVAQSAFYNGSTGMWEDTLSNAIAISDPTESVLTPLSLIANASGNALAVFNQTNGLFSNFFSAPPLQPSNGTNFVGRAASDKFLTQIDYVNFLSWTASADETVIGYYISVDGAIVANVLASMPLEAIFHNQRANTSVTYTLTSYNAAGTQSNPLTVTLR